MALQPTRWAGLPILRTAYRLNKLCTALLAETSRVESAGRCRSAVYGPRELWARIDARACERAAFCPIVLLDLNFQHQGWWNGVATRNLADPVNGQSAHFAPKQAEPLLREILMEAWSLGRSMPHAASLIFGMSLPVTAAIAGFTAQDIDRVIVERVGELRPRWEDNPFFWRSLLRAAVGTDDDALSAVVLYSLQLLG